MGSTEQNIPDEDSILRALGKLSLAAGQAESYAAQGLAYLLTDKPGDTEVAARIAIEFRSFNALYRMLVIALDDDAPLAQVIAAARSDAQKRDARGEPLLVSVMASVALSVGNSDYITHLIKHSPGATAGEYLNRVKALYDKRNECLHALKIQATAGEMHLCKPSTKGGQALVNARSLMEPCLMLRYDSTSSLARAIEAVAIELEMASLPLLVLPITIQWFRRRGTELDYAQLVDHYVGLVTQPLDDQLAALHSVEATLQAKIDSHEKSVATTASDPDR